MRFWQVVRLIISGLIVLYLQILVMPRLAIAGVIPNLFLGWIVFQVWNRPLAIFTPILLIMGICYDLTTPHYLGLQTLLFLLLAIGIDEFHKPLEKDNLLTMLITVSLTVIIYSLLMFVLNGIFFGFSLRLFLLSLGGFFYNLTATATTVAVFTLISLIRLDIQHG